MHQENKVIERKKRIMSADKDRREMEECSFTPKILRKKPKNKLNKIKSEEAASLSERMYGYAEKFKSNLECKKKVLNKERRQQMKFTPKIIQTKTLNINRDKGEVYEDLYQDHSFREQKVQEQNNKNVCY